MIVLSLIIFSVQNILQNRHSHSASPVLKIFSKLSYFSSLIQIIQSSQYIFLLYNSNNRLLFLSFSVKVFNYHCQHFPPCYRLYHITCILLLLFFGRGGVWYYSKAVVVLCIQYVKSQHVFQSSIKFAYPV